jgi:ectoine hydroxylase-related dioxygenase (phytanoyl-CoA dioxygenase family)
MTVKPKDVVISAEQIKFYDDNGYVVIPDVFDAETCEQIKAEAARVAAEDYRVYLNIHRDLPFFMDLAKDPVLIAMVKAVQRHKVVILNDQFLYKKAGTPYARQSWSPHQDNAYVKAPAGAYMQRHIFLDASDPENGGLYYYPGSQREDILPYEYVKSWAEQPDPDGIYRPGWKVQVPAQYRRVDVIAPQGAVCLQHGNVIHGSYPNLTAHRDRQQFSVAYLNEGVSFLKGNLSVKIPIQVE